MSLDERVIVETSPLETILVKIGELERYLLFLFFSQGVNGSVNETLDNLQLVYVNQILLFIEVNFFHVRLK